MGLGRRGGREGATKLFFLALRQAVQGMRAKSFRNGNVAWRMGQGKNPIRHHVRRTLHQSLIEGRPGPRSPPAGRRAPWSQGKSGVHKGRRIGLGARSSPIHARLPKCKMFGPPGRGPVVLENFDEDNAGCDEPRRARRPFAAWRDGPVRGIARARTDRAGRNSACRRRRLSQPTLAPQPQRPQGEGAGGGRTYAHDAPRPRSQKLTGQLPSPRRRRATFDDQPRFPGALRRTTNFLSASPALARSKGLNVVHWPGPSRRRGLLLSVTCHALTRLRRCRPRSRPPLSLRPGRSTSSS
jgi:hypothetical protein